MKDTADAVLWQVVEKLERKMSGLKMEIHQRYYRKFDQLVENKKDEEDEEGEECEVDDEPVRKVDIDEVNEVEG